MIIKYIVDGAEVLDKPQNGERYTENRWVDGVLAVSIESMASTPESRLESKKIEERAWRDSEIAIVSELKKEIDHPYLVELNDYLQLLRDYPSEADFPNGERPSRPISPSNHQIILTPAA
ncbi:hypothetical protein F0249_17215 [Vibrio sp. 03-59-1]|uniref:phage tail assembly chaperone n=1 Tax=Vibrio sp. 03-59-1 TaxID=2607607 RepID=UPI0014935235|nr:phage tail assembly chaperone [Vibrio sp. 03-59-1]NOH85538.1 hypothetical protein [Vibrio sp. 03-59-1]